FAGDSGLLEVVLEIDESFKARITEGSQASIKTQGALGDKYIFITPAEAQNPPLPDGGFLKSGDTKDFIDQIAAESEKLSSIGDVIQELNTLLKNINHDNNSQKLVQNLSDGGESLEKFFTKAERETLVRLNSILK